MNTSLTPLESALNLLLDGLTPVSGSETVSLLEAPGRVLAEELRAPNDVPGSDNSAMDGYAVRSIETKAAPVTLPVTQRIPAGTAGEPLATGSVARIFTGAPLPPGADAVVMQENVECLDQSVIILNGVEIGENVRRRGEDIRAGTLLFRAGQRLDVTDMHVLSACGIAELPVRKPLRVALLTTGDELVRPGAPLRPGQIYNSNYYVLASLLKGLNMDVLDCGVVEDSLDATMAALSDAASLADCVVSSGGVSVGEEDHVRKAVEQLGRIDLWKLAIKPGKPFAFGEVARRPFFGLPGNPVSAFVTFVLLVRPALLALSGAEAAGPKSFCLPVSFNVTSGERQEYLRVSLLTDRQDEGLLALCENQSSGAGSSLSQADGLAVLPPFTSVRCGDMLEFIPFSELTH